MSVLAQFLYRLAAGLAFAMAVTPPRQVTGGYFRNHSYVLLGLLALATVAALGQNERWLLAAPVAGTACSYAACLFWWRGLAGPGILALLGVAGCSLWGAYSGSGWPSPAGSLNGILTALDAPTSALVLGFTIAAMFLGHWYLNTPSMALGPLRRLVLLAAAAVVVRAAVCGTEVARTVMSAGMPGGTERSLLTLRWVAGIAAPLGLAGMTWQTLKIPNTQAATGMLYVAVIVTFLGELVELLLV